MYRVVAGIALALALGVATHSVVAAPAGLPPIDGAPESSGRDPSDDEFLDSLIGETGGTVDRVRLARLFFGLSSNLGAGRSSLRMLETQLAGPPNSRTTARNLIVASYVSYDHALNEFGKSALQMLDTPSSELALYDTQTGGHRTCWLLDQHLRLLGRYGVSDSALLPALSSVEACARFRKAAHAERVERIVGAALLAGLAQRAEAQALREEIRELERLVEELRRIDSAD